MTTTLTTPMRRPVTDDPGRVAVRRATATPARFDSVEQAVGDIAAGCAVVLIDDTGPAPEGDLIVAAQRATTALLAFMVRHGSGFVCVPMATHDYDRLALPPMQPAWDRGRTPAYTVAVDACSGIATGISASDRALTIRVLADAATGPHDLTRPGHVVPIAAHDGGVLAQPGRPEAAVDLACAAGLRPAAATCAIVSTQDPTTMAATHELRDFAAQHALTAVSLSDFVEWRRASKIYSDRTRTHDACAAAIVERPRPQVHRGEYDIPQHDRRFTA